MCIYMYVCMCMYVRVCNYQTVAFVYEIRVSDYQFLSDRVW